MTDDLKIHPLCAALRGEDLGHDVDELSAIQASMTEHGPIKGRIIVDADTGQVLDGATFMQAWNKVAATVPGFAERYPLASYIEVREFASEEDKIALVVGMQLGRRNLEPAKRLAAVQRLVNATVSDNHQERNDEKTRALTDRVLGRYASVSGSLVQAWKRVERCGIPELREIVASGRVSAKTAVDIAGMPPEQQRNVVEGGIYAIRQTVKRVRSDRKLKRRARELINGAGEEQPKVGHAGIPVDVLDALDTVSRWWNAKGRLMSERADAIRSAVLISSPQAWWKAATPQTRREFVASHWNELLGIHNKAHGKSNGVQTFDKVQAAAILERMKWGHPSDEDVAAISQWFEMMVDRL